MWTDRNWLPFIRPRYAIRLPRRLTPRWPVAVSILKEETKENLQDLVSEKESAYQALTELEFDLKAKKLSPEDYESLRREYEEVAISVLDKIDSVETGQKKKERSIEDELEEEIRKARGRGEKKK
jgi:uncharacterized lipoprotein YehR (DUF1307 family)